MRALDQSACEFDIPFLYGLNVENGLDMWGCSIPQDKVLG